MWVLEQYSTCGAWLTSSPAVFCKIVLQHYMFMLCVRTRAFFVAVFFCGPSLSETTIELKTPCQGWRVLFVIILTIMFGANHPYLVSHLLVNFGRENLSSVGLPLTRNHARFTHNLKLSRFIRPTNFPNQLQLPPPKKNTKIPNSAPRNKRFVSHYFEHVPMVPPVHWSQHLKVGPNQKENNHHCIPTIHFQEQNAILDFLEFVYIVYSCTINLII